MNNRAAAYEAAYGGNTDEDRGASKRADRAPATSDPVPANVATVIAVGDSIVVRRGERKPDDGVVITLDRKENGIVASARAIASLRARVAELELERDEAVVKARQMDGNTIIDLRRQRDELREALGEMIKLHPKSSRPIGSPHSLARLHQEDCDSAIDRALAALANTGGEG